MPSLPLCIASPAAPSARSSAWSSAQPLAGANAATVILAVALAFFFGYALTVRPVLSAGLSFGAAVRVALAADTVSITVMEIVDNAFILAIPGAMDAGLTGPLFWVTLAAAWPSPSS